MHLVRPIVRPSSLLPGKDTSESGPQAVATVARRRGLKDWRSQLFIAAASGVEDGGIGYGRGGEEATYVVA